MAPQAAPEAPGAPVTIERHVYRDGKGEHGKHERHIVMIRDGKRVEMPELPEMADMPDVPSEAEIQAMIPEIESGHCGDGKETTMEQSTVNGKRRMIICVDRIQRVAEQSRHMGMQNALMSLRMARRSIENERHMTAEERQEALKGIDDAMRELEKDRAEKDSDAS